MKKQTLIHLAWTALAGAICAVSCQTAKEADLAGERLTYDLTVVAEMAETRTANSGNSTVWVADDALNVLHIEENGSTYYGSRFYFSGENNAFKGRVSDVGAINNWYMIYPYREDNTSAEEVHITVQPELVQTGNNSKAHLAGEGFPLYGKVTNVPRSAQLNVYMSNALAVMNYNVINTTGSPIVVKSVVIAAPQPVSGSFTGDLTNDTVEWEPAGTTSTNVTVRVVDGEAIAAGANASFYAGAIPFSVAPGGQLKVKVTAVHPSAPDQEIMFYHVYNLTNGTTFSPSSIKTLNLNFDETHQNDPDGPSIKQDQTLSFANETITWTLGDTYAVGGVYDLPQEVAGAHTAVTYTSSKSEVATISDGKVRIAGVGSTTILAVAAEDDDYNAAEASFQLVIAEAAVTPTNRTYTYVDPSAPNAITAGTYVIAGSESGELSVALFPNVETKSWTSTQGAVSNGQIIPHKVLQGLSNTATTITTEDADVIGSEVTLSTSGNGWKIKVNKTGEYLVVPTQNYRISFVNEASASVFSITSGTNGATVQSGSYYFYHSGSGAGFTYRTYSTSNTRFYKLDNSKQNQTIAFENPNVTWTLGDTYAVGGTYSLPQVSGAVTTVTYTSSKTSVAQIVDGNKVKINAAGTTTITAIAAETNSYNGATASFELTVIDSTPGATTTYTKVSSNAGIVGGKRYLIVYENGASSKVFKPILNGSTYTASGANAIDAVVSGDKIESDDLADCLVTLEATGSNFYMKAAGSYLYPSQSNIGAESSPTSSRALSITISGGKVTIKRSQYTHYLGFDSYFRRMGEDTGNLALYTESGGTTPVDPTPTTNPTYTKATSLTVGGTYLITDVADQRLFKGAADGSYVSVSPVSGVITDANNSYAGYEFTVTQSGSKYCLIFNDGKYLVCDYSTSGNSTTGLVYETAKPADNYLYALSVSNGVFEFSTDQRNSTSTNQVLYYKTQAMGGTGADTFKIGGSGAGVGVHLYLKNAGGSTPTPGKQNQTLTFAQPSVSWTLGSGYSVGSSYPIQNVSGAQTAVTYTSSNTGVATITNGQIRIVAAGTTVITATAAENANYNSATATYTLTINPAATPTTGNAYVKASALTVGGTYLITDVADQRLFKGAADGSYVSVSPAGGVITDANNSYAGYEFTVTQSGSKYCLIFNDGKYLVCDYSTSGNSTTGLVYETAKPADNYLYALSVSNGVFEFSTDQRNSTSTNQVLYYKTQAMGGTGADTFKIGGSGAGIGVHLYLKNAGGSSTGQQIQSLSFANGTVTEALQTASGTMNVQAVSGAHTTVTYTSSNTSVATISGTTITIRGFGTTTITANAAATDQYYAGSATYTLVIRQASQGNVFNLENDHVAPYFDLAYANYTANNRTTTYARNYAARGSANDRYDQPKPVTVTWNNTTTSGDKTVVLYEDASHTTQVDYVAPVSVSGSSNTADVYNLIPGRTYYYVVRNGSTQVAQGSFSTEGRRRMMKVGSDYGQNYANNCRDFGGQLTTSGKTVKYGKLYRGSNMDGGSSSWWGGSSSGSLSDEAKSVLLNYMKIELDVDLRANDRKDALNLGDITLNDANTYRGHTQESYNSIDNLRNVTSMKATLTRIMNAAINNVNVYIHCMVGADRTGYTCLMLDAILGVPLEYCDIDYELTSFSCVGDRFRDGTGNVYYTQGVSDINGQTGNTFQDKAVNYLVNHYGIDRNLITRFQNAMLE